MVKMFHGFSKPKNKFIRDMVYGIQATGDTILTDISRAVDSEQKHRNVKNRLSRNLQTEGLAAEIQSAVINDARRFIDKNTLIIIDPTDVCKPHALKMEHLNATRAEAKAETHVHLGDGMSAGSPVKNVEASSPATTRQARSYAPQRLATAITDAKARLNLYLSGYGVLHAVKNRETPEKISSAQYRR